MERNLREYRRSDWNGCMQVCDGTTEAVYGSVPIHFGSAEVSRILKDWIPVIKMYSLKSGSNRTLRRNQNRQKKESRKADSWPLP